MSVQFGRWNFDGEPSAPDYIEKVQALLHPHAPDGASFYSKAGISIIYGAFHTTRESRRETQPYISESGAVITWDGRLDNRSELIHQFDGTIPTDSPDISIVGVAYERWGTNCFARLTGDWAVCIWTPFERSLILAKDPLGTRHLYYSQELDHFAWSTILDPLILHVGHSLQLDEEYIAGWLSSFPDASRTPYIGIHSVPPSSFVRIERNNRISSRYWDFDGAKTTRYRSDNEYEEHFRAVFGESVRRRLRSDSPVLAELSGGMDSSAIVCIADDIIARGNAETFRLDTVSYYDDSEPNWNEFPYFTKVEERRGRMGCHIDLSADDFFAFEFADTCTRFPATPGSSGGLTGAMSQFASCVSSRGNRAVLSGIGGDEVTGGVPTPIPELADLLARARFRTLAGQLKLWALNKRRPWFHLLFETVRDFLPSSVVATPKHRRPPVWLRSDFVKSHRSTLTGTPSRIKWLGCLPSFQENTFIMEGLRRQLANCSLPLDPPYEKRYPYLDRDLLEFLYSVPREQLVRPGHRRSLMRRALIGIVPDDLLNRKRKAFVARSVLAAISSESSSLREMSQHMLLGSMGIVDPNLFCKEVGKAQTGLEVNLVAMMRTIAIECWLRHLAGRGGLGFSVAATSEKKFDAARSVPTPEVTA